MTNDFQPDGAVIQTHDLTNDFAFVVSRYRRTEPVRIVSWMLPATYGTTLLQDVMLRGELSQPLLLAAPYIMAIVLLLLAILRSLRLMGRQTS